MERIKKSPAFDWPELEEELYEEGFPEAIVKKYKLTLDEEELSLHINVLASQGVIRLFARMVGIKIMNLDWAQVLLIL